MKNCRLIRNKLIAVLTLLPFAAIQPVSVFGFSARAGSGGSATSTGHQHSAQISSNGAPQVCAYDGKPVTIGAQPFARNVGGAGEQVVAEIMRYTGLPQNFDVFPHPRIPNAAATILVGPDKLPKRVILYNEGFMREVRIATANNNWAPVSIMAHEIGHHLSGHTIQPGASQPAAELEADKFSGFVLYKMGAKLVDATTAIETFVPPENRPTHPGRQQRSQAVTEGWRQACQQQHADCGSDGPLAAATVGTTAVTRQVQSTQSFAAAPVEVGQTSQAVTKSQAMEAPTIHPGDVLPLPTPQATPVKFDKFVIDELGILNAAERASFEKKMFDLAARQQLEIVTIVATSLNGMSGDAYALAMMRQLRVGKLDVGNGAVLVVAPHENQVGIAMGPGVLLEMREYLELEKDRLRSFLELLPQCKNGCSAEHSTMLFEAPSHLAYNAGSWDFSIAYQSLDDLLTKFTETEKARAAGAQIEPENDPTWRKITRIEGKLVSRHAAATAQAQWINEPHAESVGPPMHIVTADGRNILLYTSPQTEQLMTGKLNEGGNYLFIAREASLSLNPQEPLAFDLLSFDASR